MPRLALFLIMPLIAGCAALESPRAALAPTVFSDEPRFALSVARLVVEDESARASPRAPATGLGPADVAKSWASRRLVVHGGTGSARFRILEASVTETFAPASRQIGGYETSAQERELTARLRVELVIEGDGEPRRARGEVTAERRLGSLPSRAEIEAERDFLLSELARRFDNVMAAQTQALLAGF